MVAGRPDSASFWLAISPLLQQAPTAGRPVCVFGEMVTLLWDAGRADAALELEAMWNELGGRHYPFSLLCAYPAQPVSCAHHLDAMTEVRRVHTEVIGAAPGPNKTGRPVFDLPAPQISADCPHRSGVPRRRH